MKFSLRLNNDLPVSDYVRLAQAAERAGFDQFWVSDDLFLRSAPVILAAVAAATTRIEIGTCIVNPYTLHPAEMAMLAATLDELSGERFNLGLSAGAAEFLKWVNITPEKPLKTVTDCITAVNALFNGEPIPAWTEDAYLRFKPLRRVPIYLGAMSPHMLKTIGTLADGGLPLLFPPEHYETVLPYIQAGAAEAGRDLAQIDVAACVWCCIGGDDDPLREKIAYYGHALSPLIWDRLGLTRADFAAIEHAAMTERDMEKAKRLVTPAMLRIGIVGTTGDVIKRMERLVNMGVTHLSFGPPLGRDVLAAVEALGRDVIPYFRG
jgi:5,10-methylenetetrahydromethanopterin reductase